MRSTTKRPLRGYRSLALGAACLTAITASVAPATAATPGVAKQGAGYLARQLDANGGHFGTDEAPDVSDTAQAVLALHAAGVGRDQARTATDYLATQLGAPLQNPTGGDDPGKIGYDILAAVTDHRDPRHFGGQAAANNLIARLKATQQTTGTDTGLFGTADPTFDGAFRQGVALTALRAAGVPSTNQVVVRGTAWLRKQQCANGLWTSYRADTAVACTPADPATFTGPDTNSTGMAAQGLAAYGQRPHRTEVLNSLAAAKSADGGYPFLTAPDQPSDPNSTALAIQAVLAEGGHPGTAYAALASYQLGCGDAEADRGAFYFPFGDARDANLFATVQAVPAAAGKTFPLPPSTPSTAVPTVSC